MGVASDISRTYSLTEKNFLEQRVIVTWTGHQESPDRTERKHSEAENRDGESGGQWRRQQMGLCEIVLEQPQPLSFAVC